VSKLPIDHPYTKLVEYDRWLLRRFSERFNETKDGGSGIEPWQIDEFVMKQPRSVVALVIKPDGQVLAVSRRDHPDDLGLPGGKIDPGETPEQALVRELREETDLEAKDFTFCYERVDRSDGRVAWCYQVTVWDGLAVQREAGIRVAWVDPKRLLEERCTFREYNRGLLESLRLL